MATNAGADAVGSLGAVLSSSTYQISYQDIWVYLAGKSEKYLQSQIFLQLFKLLQLALDRLRRLTVVSPGLTALPALTTVALRFTNVYGRGMHVKDSIVARLMRAVQSGGTIQVYGSGEQSRDYVYVTDAAGSSVPGRSAADAAGAAPA